MSKKFRPYLTQHQMEFILMRLAESQDAEANEIRTAFNLLLVKIGAGIATGSYSPSPRKGVKDKLGFTFQDEQESKYLNGEMTPEEEAQYEAELIKGTGIPI